MLAYVALMCLSLVNPQQKAEKILDRLRALPGAWEGTFEWSGARSGGGKIKATYSTTGNGSAVVENLIMGDETVPSMTSVYHMDGSDLRMTHYCAAQNQPRLRATEVGENVAKFSFVDATNLTGHPGHVEAFEIRFVAENRLVLEFTFSGAKKSIEHIELTRIRQRGSE